MSLCHCLECQRRTGSTYGIAAFFARDAVKANGETSCFTRTADNGSKVSFYFCPTCGSTVYWESERKPDLIAVAAGSFADPQFPQPIQSVYEEHKHPWVNVPSQGELDTHK